MKSVLSKKEMFQEHLNELLQAKASAEGQYAALLLDLQKAQVEINHCDGAIQSMQRMIQKMEGGVLV